MEVRMPFATRKMLSDQQQAFRWRFCSELDMIVTAPNQDELDALLAFATLATPDSERVKLV